MTFTNCNFIIIIIIMIINTTLGGNCNCNGGMTGSPKYLVNGVAVSWSNSISNGVYVSGSCSMGIIIIIYIYIYVCV